MIYIYNDVAFGNLYITGNLINSFLLITLTQQIGELRTLPAIMHNFQLIEFPITYTYHETNPNSAPLC